MAKRSRNRGSGKLFTLAEIQKSLQVSDSIVAKIARITEVAQMARAETRLRDYVIAEWNRFSKKAADKAASLARSGASPAEIKRGVDEVMASWPKAVKNTVFEELDNIYRLARIAGHKKANRQTTASLSYSIPKLEEVMKAGKVVAEISPVFDLIDESAVDALNQQQMFWIGTVYGAGVANRIAEVARDSLLRGGNDLVEAARVMEKEIMSAFSGITIPPSFSGTAQQYFQGLTANAATVARAQGQLRSFMSIGVTHFTITNPMDDRTCPQCSHLDGKVFSVEAARQQMEEDLAAKSPNDLKASHPWLTYEQLKGISPSPGKVGEDDAKALNEAGVIMPPYHFRCRCAIDVSSDISYDNLSPMDSYDAPNPDRYEHATDWASNLIPSQIAAFLSWQAGAFFDIRNIQSGFELVNPGKSAAYRRYLGTMEGALATAPFYEGKIFRTFIPEEGFDISVLKKGNVIRQNTIASWTKDRALAEEYLKDRNVTAIVFQVQAVKGAHDLSYIQGSKDSEVLVSRKSYIIDSVEKTVKDGKTRLTVNLVEGDPFAEPVYGR